MGGMMLLALVSWTFCTAKIWCVVGNPPSPAREKHWQRAVLVPVSDYR